jgi:hypothetical protein
MPLLLDHNIEGYFSLTNHMKHTLKQLEAAIDIGNFKENEDWQILTSGADILHAKCSALIAVSNVQLGTLARAMQVECEVSDGNYSLTFEHNGNTVIFQTTII